MLSTRVNMRLASTVLLLLLVATVTSVDLNVYGATLVNFLPGAVFTFSRLVLQGGQMVPIAQSTALGLQTNAVWAISQIAWQGAIYVATGAGPLRREREYTITTDLNAIPQVREEGCDNPLIISFQRIAKRSVVYGSTNMTYTTMGLSDDGLGTYTYDIRAKDISPDPLLMSDYTPRSLMGAISAVTLYVHDSMVPYAEATAIIYKDGEEFTKIQIGM